GLPAALPDDRLGRRAWAGEGLRPLRRRRERAGRGRSAAAAARRRQHRARRRAWARADLRALLATPAFRRGGAVGAPGAWGAGGKRHPGDGKARGRRRRTDLRAARESQPMRRAPRPGDADGGSHRRRVLVVAIVVFAFGAWRPARAETRRMAVVVGHNVGSG